MAIGKLDFSLIRIWEDSYDNAREKGFQLCYPQVLIESNHNNVQPMPRPPRLNSVQGKTLYLVDVGFGGGWEFWKRLFHGQPYMPSVNTVLPA